MRVALCILLIAGTVTMAPWAQDRPDFSGVWSVVPSRSVWYNGGRPVDITVFGNRFTAEQTPSTLKIAIENEGGFKWSYRLDGAATKNLPLGPDGPQETSSTAAWRGSALVITTKVVVNRDSAVRHAETTRRLQLNEDGTLSVQAPWGRNGTMIGSVYSRVR